MTYDPHSRIGCQNTFDAFRRFGGTVGDDDLTGVEAVADSDASALMQRNPGRPARDVYHRVEIDPVGDGVGAVEHRFGLAVGRGDAAAVQVIAADHDRSF